MYPLTTREEKELKNTWKFLRIFVPQGLDEEWYKKDGKLYGPYDYREYIIKAMQGKNKDFYKYEKIINKLFWNLKLKLKPFILKKKTKYKIININSIKRVPSCINSYLQYNEKNNK